MITDPTRIAEILLGLGAINLLGVDEKPDGSLTVMIETRNTIQECPRCSCVSKPKERRSQVVTDLAICKRPLHLMWRKRRFLCLNTACLTKSFTEDEPAIANRRLRLTNRASKWATLQVGKYGRSVSSVADELGCDWHTVNDAVVAYGEILVDDPSRIGEVISLGLDESLFVRQGEFRQQIWTTSIVDSKEGYLLDMVPGRAAKESIEWINKRPKSWRDAIKFGTMDLSGPYSKVFDEALPHVRKVADPFHVVKLANSKLDECRRRVQHEVFGSRGLAQDPLYRCRKLLSMAAERLSEKANKKMRGLLEAGDPRGDVMTAWRAKEAVRELYTHTDEKLANQWVDTLVDTMFDEDYPVEVRSLSRTLKKWKKEIVAWHCSQVSNAPTEAMNNLIKRTKRIAFGFVNFRNFRIRALLYAGRVNWDLLESARPY